ncbi:sporulation histidine kinase inhibitor Sda [Cohnella yongneupensis]|uniref:Sporulation histidine kinase inhibitor Sda n=1 Tax=Cohnella yongneupensis TaxID=425006 RepID=A0ABW0R035_9BACL
MRKMSETVHHMDDELLITQFNKVAPFSPDDEFIQMLLREIKNRKLNIEDVLKDLYLQ